MSVALKEKKNKSKLVASKDISIWISGSVFVLVVVLLIGVMFSNVHQIRTLLGEQQELNDHKIELLSLEAYPQLRQNLPVLISRKQISSAVDEIIALGKEAQIQFSSIDIQPVRRKSKKASFIYEELEIVVQGEFHQINQWILDLRNLKKSTLYLQELNMMPAKEMGTFSQAELNIHMFLKK